MVRRSGGRKIRTRLRPRVSGTRKVSVTKAVFVRPRPPSTPTPPANQPGLAYDFPFDLE